MTKKKKQVTDRSEPAAIIRELICKYYNVLIQEATKNAKIGDLIKMIELHQKIAPDESHQKELWERVSQVRKDVLAREREKKNDKTVEKQEQTRS